MLHEFRSILDPLDLVALFSKVQPLEVELGCGDGSFLAEYAREHPSITLSAWNGCWGGFANWGGKACARG